MGNHQINMKLVAATIACLGMSTQAALPSRFDEGAGKFAEFKRNHGKFYNNQAEESRRLAIFKENLAFIARHNMDFLSGRETFSVGINKFTDLTNSEYRTRHLAEMVESPNIRLNYQCPVNFQATGSALPENVDWRSTLKARSVSLETRTVNLGKEPASNSLWTAAGRIIMIWVIIMIMVATVAGLIMDFTTFKLQAI